jgi:hypothetical protein
MADRYEIDPDETNVVREVETKGKALIILMDAPAEIETQIAAEAVKLMNKLHPAPEPKPLKMTEMEVGLMAADVATALKITNTIAFLNGVTDGYCQGFDVSTGLSFHDLNDQWEYDMGTYIGAGLAKRILPPVLKLSGGMKSIPIEPRTGTGRLHGDEPKPEPHFRRPVGVDCLLNADYAALEKRIVAGLPTPEFYVRFHKHADDILRGIVVVGPFDVVEMQGSKLIVQSKGHTEFTLARISANHSHLWEYDQHYYYGFSILREDQSCN